MSRKCQQHNFLDCRLLEGRLQMNGDGKVGDKSSPCVKEVLPRISVHWNAIAFFINGNVPWCWIAHIFYVIAAAY